MEQQKKQQHEKPVAVVATGLLTVDEILAIDDITHIDVPIPEWTPGYVDGGIARAIRIRCMTADEAMVFAESQADEVLRRDTMVRLIQQCAVNEDGTSVFGAGHVDALRQKSFVVFNRLQKAILKLNGFTDDEDPVEAEKKD